MDCRASASLAERKMVAFPRAPNLNLIRIRNPIPIRDSMITTPPTAQSHRSLIETPATPPTAPPRFFLKLNRRFVPGQDRPFHPSAIVVARDLCQMHQQSATITATAHFRFHKQILQIKPGAPEPGGEVKKINREPNRCSIFKCNHHLRCRLRAKKHFMQTFLGGDYVIGRTLVGREITNQL